MQKNQHTTKAKQKKGNVDSKCYHCFRMWGRYKNPSATEVHGVKVHQWILKSKLPAQFLVQEKPKADECWKLGLEIQRKDKSDLLCFFFQKYLLL